MNKVVLEKWTKAEMEQFLGNQSGQRRLNKARVRSWTRIFDLGLYKPENPGQTAIMISPEGTGFNGQHRAAGGVASKLKSIVFPVMRGVDPKWFPYIDVALYVRNVKDAFSNQPNVHRDVARLRWLYSIVTGELKPVLTPAEIRVHMDDTFKAELEWAGKHFPGTGNHMSAPYIGTLMYAYSADPKFVSEFAPHWMTGDGLPPVLRRMRDVSQRPTRKKKQDGGGVIYTHVPLMKKMLNVLSYMHNGDEAPLQVRETLNGLNYFSKILNDRVGEIWKP